MSAPAVGIIGLGSIGRRHAHQLHAQGASVVALRRPGSRPAPELEFVEDVYEPEALWDHALEALVVSNPTALHVDALGESLARTSCRVLVEKPLAVSTAQAAIIVPAHRDRVRVAYCLRFHPAVRAVTAVIRSGEVGRIYAARIRFGSYLPAWHPGDDFRAGYAARRDLGGGALRTLSHELDLVAHWLGAVETVSGAVESLSGLTPDVDDAAYLTCRTSSGALVAVDLDFVTPGYDRRGQLIGEEGRVDYCLNPTATRVTVTGRSGEQREVQVSGLEGMYADQARCGFDEMYADQARDLLQWARGGESSACRYEQAEHVLRIIEAAESSTRTWVPV